MGAGSGDHEEGLVGVVGRTNGEHFPVSLERAEGMCRDFGQRHRRPLLPALAGFAPLENNNKARGSY